MKYIKIKETEVKTVERQDSTKTLCLTIKYKIGWFNWECNIIDYEDNAHNKKKIIEKVKKEIRKSYNNLTAEQLLGNK